MDRCQYNNFVGCNIKKCDTCEVYKVYQQGRRDERKKIMEIVDGADDIAQAMYLLGQYIISEELEKWENLVKNVSIIIKKIILVRVKIVLNKTKEQKWKPSVRYAQLCVIYREEKN